MFLIVSAFDKAAFLFDSVIADFGGAVGRMASVAGACLCQEPEVVTVAALRSSDQLLLVATGNALTASFTHSLDCCYDRH